MSLLLDALKKAAQEKQKASEDNRKDKATPEPEKGNTETADDGLELRLDDDLNDEHQTQTEKTDEPELSLDPVPGLEKTSATNTTVSDEALQLLVYKTNKQHRRSQKIIWGSIVSGAFFILLAGGATYYYAMLEDVEALERKHEQAMRIVQNAPVTRPHILQSMQESRAASSKAASDKTVASDKQTKKQPKNKAAAKAATSPPVKKSANLVSIRKTEKLDPVSVLLNRAWHAYAAQDYATAEKAYSEVLRREPKNRDALLGDAAVAVKKMDYTRARSAYSLLLRLDPRDPIANAALAGLDEAATDALGESKLKFMLQQQPDATHLHFALGNLYAQQKKWPQAQGEYFSAWQGAGDNADYAFNLAVSLDQMGKYKEARRFYEISLARSVGQNISFSVEAVKQRLAQLAER